MNLEDLSERGACVGLDPEVFFPVSSELAEFAVAVCRTCPVMRECGELADRHGMKFGVWGGVDRETLPRTGRRGPKPDWNQWTGLTWDVDRGSIEE